MNIHFGWNIYVYALGFGFNFLKFHGAIHGDR